MLKGKVIHLIFSTDKMVGRDFEAGLAQLKALTETSLVASRGAERQ
jgi:hypothetical protein